MQKRTRRRQDNKMKLMKTGAKSAMVLSLLVGGATTTIATETDYESIGAVEFRQGVSPTQPVDPTNPLIPIEPVNPPQEGTYGPLSIDFAPELDFAINEISYEDEIYNAKLVNVKEEEEVDSETLSKRREVPNFIQVTDKRGTNDGWTLEVKQDGQFRNESTLNKELKGAQISLTKTIAVSTSTAKAPTVNSQIDLDPTGASSKIMSASVNSGAGTWLAVFGAEQVDAKDAITLSVPGVTVKDSVFYFTNLTWTLTNTPGNNTEADLEA